MENLRIKVNDALKKIRVLGEETNNISEEIKEIIAGFREMLEKDIKTAQSDNLKQFMKSSFIHHFCRDMNNKASLYKEMSEWKRNRLRKTRAIHLEEYLKVIRDYLDDGYIKIYPIYIGTDSFYPIWYVWYEFKKEFVPFHLKMEPEGEKEYDLYYR